MASLASIVYKPKNAAPVGNAYLRAPIERARLTAGYGIDGDGKGGGNRQLNIMAAETVGALAQEGFLAEPGQLGEQLMVSGIDVDALPVGTRLRIGADACVELYEPRTGCAKFERYQKRSPRECAGRLGYMARVVAAGEIAVGDPVAIVPAAE